ncbi:helix-turn-helix domain-containing protein [Halofilum ochraceum]|uniref:helix-turn-helix domain-containing protein n=1 Tax=Halofilum ochraceum TaxID=1611323 RepID=UPI00082CB15E|nr:XRE family transcriptional regulator [Halofilum ochraceum]
MDQPLSNLGSRVKTLRQERGLTLQQVSERSGVSVSTLSKVENGQVSGTINTMLKIARGLGVLFDHLLEDTDTNPPPTGRLVRTTADQVDRFPTEFYDYQVHSTEMVGRHMLPLVIDVKTRQPPPKVDWSTHEGEEFLLVLEGRVEFHSEHYGPVALNPGDSIYFDSSMRHAYVSVGEGDARVISISLAQEESAAGTRMTHLQRRRDDHQEQSPSRSTPGDDAIVPARTSTSQSSNPFGGRTEP